MSSVVAVELLNGRTYPWKHPHIPATGQTVNISGTLYRVSNIVWYSDYTDNIEIVLETLSHWSD